MSEIGPDFIIIGFPKCGTTSLVDNLGRHSKINMFYDVGNKESVYYHTSHYYKLGKDFYKNKLKPGMINGEKNPTYIWNNFTLLNIKRRLPNVKVIVSLRNPPDYLYSWYHQLYVNSNCNCDDCKKRKEEKKKKGIKNNKLSFEDFIEMPHQVENSYFINHIIRAIDIFGKDKIHFIIQEEYEKDSQKELNKIFKFLGIKLENFEKITKFKGKRPDGLIDQYLRKKLVEKYKSHNEELFKILGYRIESWK